MQLTIIYMVTVGRVMANLFDFISERKLSTSSQLPLAAVTIVSRLS